MRSAVRQLWQPVAAPDALIAVPRLVALTLAVSWAVTADSLAAAVERRVC